MILRVSKLSSFKVKHVQVCYKNSIKKCLSLSSHYYSLLRSEGSGVVKND
jgi:hypothetical protein